MERKPASMERFVSRANLQKQRSYCNKIISEIKKNLIKDSLDNNGSRVKASLCSLGNMVKLFSAH